MATFGEVLQPRTSGSNGQALTAVADFETLMKKGFKQPAGLSAAEQQVVQLHRDPAAAFDLIDRAAETLDVLVSRCEQLEAKMHSDAERAKAEASAQAEVVEQWKKFGSGMRAEAEDANRQLQAMVARSEAAEARAAAAEARALALQQASEAAAQRAAAAENLAKEFHDKVIATFGTGSRAQAALNLAATGGGVEQGASAA